MKLKFSKRRALFVPWVLVATLAGLEIVLRLWGTAPLFERITITSDGAEYALSADPRLFYVPRPGAGEFNAGGYRGEWVPTEREPGVERIVVMGDSVAEGLGVAHTDRFTSLLSKELGQDHEVVNLAVRGYNLRQEVAYFEEQGRRYQPDHVVFSTSFNDLHSESGELAALARHVQDSRRGAFYRDYYAARRGLDSLLLTSHVYRSARYLVSGPALRDDPEAASDGDCLRMCKACGGMGRNEEGQRCERCAGQGTEAAKDCSELDRQLLAEVTDPELQQLVAQVHELCVADGASLSFVFVPARGLPTEDAPIARIERVVADRGIPALDLDDRVPGADRSKFVDELLLPRDPCHLSARGHAWVAGEILDSDLPFVRPR
jgi:hypothetical protein